MCPNASINRRSFLVATTGLCPSLSMLASPRPSKASLVQFPANKLSNKYLLARSGLSNAEEGNVLVSNPVWKQSYASSLSEPGRQQVLNQTVPALSEACSEGCWLWPSMTMGSYQTAELLAERLSIGRSRIVPEYSFLDKRGLGLYEDQPLASVREAVAEADALDPSWKPSPNTDGTPNESAFDVLVRVRQLLSITETQYNGEVIVLISPDSYCLSILQAAVKGVDLRRHDLFAFEPGQVRSLELSEVEFDAAPQRMACPNPPKCTAKLRAPTRGWEPVL
jgi:broad specificity phosphatase PhoE